MATVQVRIEGNALTTPPSYSVRFVPKDTLGYDELAAEVVQMHPNYAQEDAKTIIMAAMERIGVNLINGNQTVLPVPSPSASPSARGWTRRTTRCRRLRTCSMCAFMRPNPALKRCSGRCAD
ncbi:MAG: hypothetical protein ACTFAL_13235 [Candidatus Electronema sp. V4]|uniref:hypothetical protein n=1 Tax=Candidatus Electronema sp. V4 TaxID=3454756 RepID=UPI00405580F4